MLAALGRTDFGLCGVVGGMAVMALLDLGMRRAGGGSAAVGLTYGSSDEIFFAWGGSTMCHPPVLLIEAFNDGAK